MTLAIPSAPRLGNITLSRGASTPYRIPANMGAPYPVDGTCYVQFIDTNGDDVGGPIAGSVFVDQLQWLFDPNEVDVVKRGMNFEAFLVTSDGTKFKLRYGKVVRREAAFEYAALVRDVAKLYSDNFAGRTGQPGNMYAHVHGNTTIHDNSGILGIGATGNGLGVDIGLLYETSAVRVNRPLTGDSCRMSVTLVNPFGVATGVTYVGICGNTNITSGLALKFDSQNQWVTLAEMTGPNTAVDLTSNAPDTVANYNYYTLDYNDLTKTFQVFKGNSLTPLLSWTDDTDVIVHGQGYRYPFFSFNASLLSSGAQINAWEAEDYVGAG